MHHRNGQRVLTKQYWSVAISTRRMSFLKTHKKQATLLQLLIFVIQPNIGIKYIL